MTRLFLKIFDFFTIRKWLLQCLLVVVISISIVGALRLDFGEDISDFLPVGEDYSSVNRFVQEASGNSRIMIFFKDNDSIFDPNRVAECMDKYAAELKQNDSKHLFDRLSAGYDDTKIYGLSGFIQQNIPLFIDDNDYLHADSLVNQQHTEAALATDKRLLTSPVPSYVKNVIKNDPLGLFVHKLEDLKSFRPTECYSFINGHIFEPEMRRGIIFFDSPTGMSESNVNAQIVSELQKSIASVAADYPGWQFATDSDGHHCYGVDVYCADNVDIMVFDSQLEKPFVDDIDVDVCVFGNGCACVDCFRQNFAYLVGYQRGIYRYCGQLSFAFHYASLSLRRHPP